jgi:hypothetical protein
MWKESSHGAATYMLKVGYGLFWNFAFGIHVEAILGLKNDGWVTVCRAERCRAARLQCCKIIGCNLAVIYSNTKYQKRILETLQHRMQAQCIFCFTLNSYVLKISNLSVQNLTLSFLIFHFKQWDVAKINSHLNYFIVSQCTIHCI